MLLIVNRKTEEMHDESFANCSVFGLLSIAQLDLILPRGLLTNLFGLYAITSLATVSLPAFALLLESCDSFKQ